MNYAEVKAIMEDWKKEVKLRGVIQISSNFNPESTELTICTSAPGLMIGKKGVDIKKYKERLKEFAPNLDKIIFVETDGQYIR